MNASRPSGLDCRGTFDRNPCRQQEGCELSSCEKSWFLVWPGQDVFFFFTCSRGGVPGYGPGAAAGWEELASWLKTLSHNMGQGLDEHYKGTSDVVWVDGIQAEQEQSIIALDPVIATEALSTATQAFGCFLSGMYQNDAMAQDSRVQFFVMIVFELLGTSLPTINFLHCYRNCASNIDIWKHKGHGTWDRRVCSGKKKLPQEKFQGTS